MAVSGYLKSQHVNGSFFSHLFCVKGGTFALYSLLCRHARLSMLPNQQETDEKLSAYGVEKTAETWQSFCLKSFFEKHPKFRKGLLIFVLLGTCMTIGDGVFTPAISGSCLIL